MWYHAGRGRGVLAGKAGGKEQLLGQNRKYEGGLANCRQGEGRGDCRAAL